MSDWTIALPGETYESFAGEVSRSMDQGLQGPVRFNNLAIPPGSEMADPEYRNKYGLVTMECEIVNTDGALPAAGEPIKTRDIVVATRAMPREDWVRTRVFCWVAELLHFDKLAQIPFVLAHESAGISYRDLIELFSDGLFQSLGERIKKSFPVLSEVRTFFLNKAKDLQNGGGELCHAQSWLNAWWPADEYMLIELCTNNKVRRFYDELESALRLFLQKRSSQMNLSALSEGVELNYSLLKRPFATQDLELELPHNIWEYYMSALKGIKIPLEYGPCHYLLDRSTKKWASWQEWYKEVVRDLKTKDEIFYDCRRIPRPASPPVKI